MRIFILKSPPSRAQARTAHVPIARGVGDLFTQQPTAEIIHRDPRLQHRVTNEAGRPDRRQAGGACGTIHGYERRADWRRWAVSPSAQAAARSRCVTNTKPSTSETETIAAAA